MASEKSERDSGNENMKKILPIIAIMLVLIITLITVFGVSAKNKENDPNTAPDTVDTPQSPEDQQVTIPDDSVTSGYTNPLTGLECESDVSNLRPYAVMYNNLTLAQPQLGISQADIIYETLVEGGITRMMALFQTVPDDLVLGSIRSARPYYIDLALAYDAVYIHAGGSEYAYNKLSSNNVTHLDGVNGSRQDIFYRDADRRATMGYEHSMCTTGELINNYLPTYGFRLDHEDVYKCNLSFTENAAPASGAKAEEITVNFGSSKTTSFSYDSADKLYYAYQYDGEYIDGNEDKQVAVTNVLVLKTSIYQISGDTEGRLDMVLTGTGSGYFICGGKQIPITWSKDSISSQFEYFLEDGSPLSIGQGRTYVCITTNDSDIEMK